MLELLIAGFVSYCVAKACDFLLKILMNKKFRQTLWTILRKFFEKLK